MYMKYVLVRITHEQEGQWRYDVQLRSFRPTVVAVEKRLVLRIVSLCVCVCVAVGIQHAMLMRHFVICGLPVFAPFCHVACPSLQYFPTLSHKRYDFRKKKLLNTKCVFWFPLQLLSETFLILRRNERHTIKSFSGLHVKYPLILSYFKETSFFFSTGFRKILKHRISWKFVQWEPSCGLTDEWTDRHDEAISRFSQLC